MENKIYTDCKVKIKSNTIHPTIPDLSIGNWTGIIVSFFKKNEDYYCKINLDTITIQNMSIEYIENCIQLNLNYTQLILKSTHCEPI